MRPQQLLGHEIIHARLLVDLRQLPVVAERVGIPSDLYIHAEVFLEIPFPDENLPDQRLARGHVEVRLHPHAADNFPAALFHALLDLLIQVRIFFLHPLVGAGR